jgi:hypothetical protein
MAFSLGSKVEPGLKAQTKASLSTSACYIKPLFEGDNSQLGCLQIMQKQDRTRDMIFTWKILSEKTTSAN